MRSTLYRYKSRPINRYIIDLIIISISLLISSSYIIPISTAKYLLFLAVGLSYALLFLTRIPTNSRSNIRLKYSYYLLLISSLLYSILLRNNFQNFVIFSSSVILLVYLYNYGLDKSNIFLLYFSNVFLTIAHVMGSRDPDAFTVSENALVLGFQNSNMTGIVISSSIFILITGLYYFKGKEIKLLLLVLIIIDSYLLFKTNNRGSMLAIAVFLIFLILSRSKNREFKLARTSVLQFPVLFIFIIALLVSVLPNDIMLNDKPLFSGREREWEILVERMLSDPLNIHKLPMGGLNYVIVGIIEYGFIAIFLFMYILSLMKPKIIFNIGITFRNVAYLAFISVFIQQAFEATIITGSYGVYVNSYLLLGIACSNFNFHKPEHL